MVIDDDTLSEFIEDSKSYIEDELYIDLRAFFDLIEMIAGRKPVYMMRGHLSPMWNQYVMSMVSNSWGPMSSSPADLLATETWMWEHENPVSRWPWVMRRNVAKNHRFPCLSISDDVINELDQLGSIVPMAQEARLLGYPLCCVEAYHARHHAYADHVLDAYRALGNAEAIRAHIRGNAVVPIDPKAAEIWKNGYLSPLCSFAYCEHCASDSDAPGPQMNRARRRFLEPLVPDLLERVDSLEPDRIAAWKDRLNRRSEGITWADDVKWYDWR